MAKRRIRTHANPLAYPDPIPRASWTNVLGEDKPLYVDMGCGQGQFIIASAKKHPERNYVGIEVRQSMAEKVNERIQKEGLRNVICLAGNASISLRSLFKKGELKELYINFPDPWVKPRHHKRRMIKEPVVDDLAFVLADNGVISLLTDVQEIYDDFFAFLSARFVARRYLKQTEKTYWQDWHEQHGTKLFGSCFKKQ